MDWHWHSHYLICQVDTCYVQYKKYSEEEWESVEPQRGLVCISIHTYLVDFEHTVIYFSLLHIPSYLKHWNFWFPLINTYLIWLSLKITVFPALLFTVWDPWNTFNSLHFSSPSVTMFSILVSYIFKPPTSVVTLPLGLAMLII